MKMKDYKSVDKYIADSDPQVQDMLKKLRQTIKTSAPDAIELISYKMPAYKLNGKPLIYFAAWKNHVSVYPASGTLLAKIPALNKYHSSKGTLKFPSNKPIPKGLIEKIIKFKIKEIKNGKNK